MKVGFEQWENPRNSAVRIVDSCYCFYRFQKNKIAVRIIDSCYCFYRFQKNKISNEFRKNETERVEEGVRAGDGSD